MLCFILLHAVASKPISKGYPSGYLMAILTTKKASAIKPGSAALPHGGVVGLWLFPYETPGHGQWKIRYTSPTTGKRRAKSLGAFPEIGIAEAGRLGQSIRDAVDAGIDPLDVSLSPKKELAPVIDLPPSPQWQRPRLPSIRPNCQAGKTPSTPPSGSAHCKPTRCQ
jgi:hypothetical protein